MNLNTSPVPSVAIIGTEGAGKTVLTAVMAKRLGDPGKGMFLNAQGPKTLKHVEKVWSILQRGDWPEGNPAGELFELRWKLEIDGYYVCDVRFIESAGQDIRVLFEGEQFHTASTPELRNLATYCGQSDIVIFLVNLADFIGKKDPELKASNEAAIKAAMDTLSQSEKTQRFCIVITQADLFHGEVERFGSWNDVLKAYLSNLHGAYVYSQKARVFPVSAVCDTVVRDDGEGRMIRVPMTGFKSEGLDDLIFWLKTNTQSVAKESREQSSVPTLQPFVSPLRSDLFPSTTPESTQETPEKTPWATIISALIAFLLSLTVCLIVLPKIFTSEGDILGHKFIIVDYVSIVFITIIVTSGVTTAVSCIVFWIEECIKKL